MSGHTEPPAPESAFPALAIVIVLALAFAIGFLMGRDPAPKDDTAYPRYEVTDNADAAAQAPKGSVEIRHPCLRMRSEGQADLCAQWKAAAAAERGAAEARRATDWAILGILVGALTIAGLVINIFQSARALNEARRNNALTEAANRDAAEDARLASLATTKALEYAHLSAAAAKEQVEVSRDTAQRELRAYLYPVKSP